MNLQIETQGANVFLVYEVEEKEAIDEFGCGMINNNKITGLNKLAVIHNDNKIYIKYNVSGKISLKQFFAGVVSRSRFITVITSILASIVEADQYMLELSQFILDPNYIYCNVSNGQAELVYLPIERQDVQFNFSNFIKDIMFNTQFDTNENCDYLAKIIGYINANPNLVLADLKNFINSLSSDDKTTMPIKEAEIPAANRIAASSPSGQATNIPQAAPPTTAAPIPEKVGKMFCSNCGREIKVSDKFCSFCGKTQTVGTINVPNRPSIPSTPSVPSVPSVPSAPSAPEEVKGEKKGLFGWKKKNNSNVKPKEKAAADKGKPATSFNAGFAVPGQGIPTKTPTNIAQPVSVNSPLPPQGEKLTFGTMSNNMQSIPNTVQGNFGETTVLSNPNGGETTVLSTSAVNAANFPFLIRLKNGEKIYINKPVFRLGKEKSYVDYFIGDNTAVSRSHADVITKNGEYFLLDNNSTNHTYINNMMIQSVVEVKIGHGTRIRLANEEFEFKLY